MNSKRHPLHAVGLIAAASLLLSPIWIVTPSPAIRVKARKNARLRLEVSVPTCCGIDLKSAQMNTKAGVIPHEIGPFTFKLQPKAKTLRQVEAGQKVLATVQMRTPAIVGLGSPTATIVKRLKR